MSAATQFLTVDPKKKVVIINREITPAAGDSVLLTSYIAAGYKQTGKKQGCCPASCLGCHYAVQNGH